MSENETQVHGHCDARFTAVREAFEENFRERGELGAAVAVTVGGETVVDLWGGWADAARSRPWERDTLVNVWSTTKGPAALCAHILADRGLLDLDAPVAVYWPEFAAAGKEQGPRTAPAVPPRRSGRPAGAALAGAALRLGADHTAARGDRALVGTGHAVRLPRADLRLSGRRGRTAGVGAAPGGLPGSGR